MYNAYLTKDPLVNETGKAANIKKVKGIAKETRVDDF